LEKSNEAVIIAFMVITYYGQAFTRLQFGDMVVAVNPISKDFDTKAPKFGADIALVSQNHEVFNGKDNVSFGSKEAFVIESPGEYELSGVFIKGFGTTGPHGRINTVYAVELEGMHIVHLGGIADEKMTPDILEEISSADIVFAPLGEADSLDYKTMAKLVKSIEAKIVVPVLFDATSLSAFTKEMGADKVTPTDKLSLKRKDLEGKSGEVVVLTEAK
jgi:hypothetical protein